MLKCYILIQIKPHCNLTSGCRDTGTCVYLTNSLSKAEKKKRLSQLPWVQNSKRYTFFGFFSQKRLCVTQIIYIFSCILGHLFLFFPLMIKKREKKLKTLKTSKIQQVNLHDPSGEVAVTCRELQYHSELA